jgi:ATP-dependent DNA helicase RecG
MFDIYTQNITYLQGVGPQRAELLQQELKLRTMHDLLYYFPYKYVDRSKIYQIGEIRGSMPHIQIKGQIVAIEVVDEGRQRRMVAHFSDGTGTVDLVWFKGIKYATKRYQVNRTYVVFGKATVFNGRLNFAHPEIEEADEAVPQTMGLRPYYNTTEKMKRRYLNSQAIESLQRNLLTAVLDKVEETLPDGMLQKYELMPLQEALQSIHFPSHPDDLRKAQYRLKFEELFYIQLDILRYMQERTQRTQGYVFAKIGESFNGFYQEKLPFELTGAQKRVLKEIRNDVRTGQQMNRLLQGDVGSGKTLVALMSMLMAKDNAYQSCMMAPTEILANQHYETLKEMLGDLKVSVALLTGSVKGKKRKKILEELVTGEIDILVGTHAVIEDQVQFHRLGMVIIDEQHRFGVAQRAKLWKKSALTPHVLVMTATPIPRTLAMTVYGDLEVSVIDELPPGRKPVKTIHQFDNKRGALFSFIQQQMDEGRQIYMVFPLVKESEKMDLKNLEEGYQVVCEAFPNQKVCKVHGKMKPAEKEAEMLLFSKGEAQIMVATTVIEVGVNVPNASVMVIENAERFGLSQLHQLRGRVGRGADQSYCILMTSYKLSEDTRKRIEIMVQTNDGFEIAEADLKLRGPGDLEGTQQSGIAFDLKLANIVRDERLMKYVREIAQQVLNEDVEHQLPANKRIWRQLRRLRKNKINWSSIS